MGKQFLDDLAEQDFSLKEVNGRYRLSGNEINEGVKPLGLEPFFWTIQYLKRKGIKEKIKLKAPLTGPFTLASYIETKTGSFPFNTAITNKEIVKQLTRIISKSCNRVSEEASVISIDEPILGTIVGTRILFGYSEEDIVETYDYLKNKCGKKIVGTHICGKISPKMATTLLHTKLDFLSHEFFDTPENIKVYTPRKLEESRKVLSVGCLSSKNPNIEKSEEILKTMKKFGEYKELFFTPDCGFRNLIIEKSREKGYKKSIEKLKNMIEATKKLNKL
jgi:methionine synthase II (cobalamin-independent)